MIKYFVYADEGVYSCGLEALMEFLEEKFHLFTPEGLVWHLLLTREDEIAKAFKFRKERFDLFEEIATEKTEDGFVLRFYDADYDQERLYISTKYPEGHEGKIEKVEVKEEELEAAK